MKPAIKRRRPWAEHEDAFLRQHPHEIKLLMETLQRSAGSIMARRRALGLSRRMQVVNSYAPTEYQGPAGWDQDSGRHPCQECDLSTAKLLAVQGHTTMRWECRACSARWRYLARIYDEPLHQAPDFAEIWPAEIATEELAI